MVEIVTIGIDTAKYVFQVHAVDRNGKTIFNRRLRRDRVVEFFGSLPPCLVGMEACGTSHHWAREIAACGHEVKLMPPIYVRPYVKRNKHDAADAEAICEAVRRPNMRFVPVKTVEQQAALAAHTVRDLLVRQRTQLANALRGHLAEFGVVVAQGLHRIKELEPALDDGRVPPAASAALRCVLDGIEDLNRRITELEISIRNSVRANPLAKLIMTVPGVGPIIAARVVASVPDAGAFRSGRDFAAWLGLVPRQSSTGGKTRLGRISKQGNRMLRRLFVNGAMAALFRSKEVRADPWVIGLRGRKPMLVTAVALANKMARAVWAVMRRGTAWEPRLANPTAALAAVQA